MIDAQNSPFRGLGGRLINYKKKKAAQTGSFFSLKSFQITVPPEIDCNIPNVNITMGTINNSMLNAIIISTPTKRARRRRFNNPVSNML